MKTLLTFLLLLPLLFGTGTNVYICESPAAVAYHANSKCRGLQKCTHQILIVTTREANDKGLRPCKICYQY